MISNLSVSDTVEICVTDKVLQKHYYKTKIQDISLENTFFTMIPSSDTGRPVIFFKEQDYELYAKNAEGIQVWTVHYLGTQRIDNIPACRFQAISGPIMTQRREFYRQSVSLNCTFFMVSLGDEGKADTTVEHTGRILDLSGGGCAFMCSDYMPIHSELTIYFTFRGSDFTFKSEVLDRIDYSNTRSDWDFKFRVKWIKPGNRVVDNLIRLVFDQQREFLLNSNSR